MSSVLTTPTATLADLLHSLGDIDPARIRLQPPPGTATEQHVLDIQAHEGRLCELVRIRAGGGPVLPGFTLPVHELFAELDREAGAGSAA